MHSGIDVLSGCVNTELRLGGKLFIHLEAAPCWHQRADERHGKPLQGNQQLLVAKDKVGRLPGEFGVSKSIGCDIFSSVL